MAIQFRGLAEDYIGLPEAAAAEPGGEGSLSAKLRQISRAVEPDTWSETGDSDPNTALTLTHAAEAGKRHYVTMIEVAISGAAAGADITVELKDGDTTKWKEIIGNGATQGERVGFVYLHGIKMNENSDVNLVVSAGGDGVVTHVNMAGKTVVV